MPAQEVARRTPDTYAGELLSLSFRDHAFDSALDLIAEIASLRLHLSPCVEEGLAGKTITLELNDVPWDAALAVMLDTFGVAARTHDKDVYLFCGAPEAGG